MKKVSILESFLMLNHFCFYFMLWNISSGFQSWNSGFNFVYDLQIFFDRTSWLSKIMDSAILVENN